MDATRADRLDAVRQTDERIAELEELKEKLHFGIAEFGDKSWLRVELKRHGIAVENDDALLAELEGQILKLREYRGQIAPLSSPASEPERS